MKLRTRLLLLPLIAIPVVSGVVIGWFSSKGPIWNSWKNPDPRHERNPLSSNGINGGLPDENSNSDLSRNAGSSRSSGDRHPAGFTHVGVIHREVVPLMDFLNKSEAARCRMVLEKRFQDANSYFLEALPPTREEVIATRSMIAEIMENAPPHKKEEIDNNIGKLIYEYGAFGESKKIICIRVPDDPEAPLSAWYYAVEDVEKEIERLFSGAEITAPEDMQLYVGSEPNTLSRFKSLLVQPEPE